VRCNVNFPFLSEVVPLTLPSTQMFANWSGSDVTASITRPETCVVCEKHRKGELIAIKKRVGRTEIGKYFMV